MSIIALVCYIVYAIVTDWAKSRLQQREEIVLEATMHTENLARDMDPHEINMSAAW